MPTKKKYTNHSPSKTTKRTKLVSKHPIIIHISGASGAGKTTLGNKLKAKFGAKIIVKDLDDLRAEFEKLNYDPSWDYTKLEHTKLERYIDDFILKQRKPLILVGLNNMFWWHKNLYYNTHVTHKYYIQIDNMRVVKQKCLQWITKDLQDLIKNKDVLSDITENNPKFVRLIKNLVERECGIKKTLKINEMWDKAYAKQGYSIMPRDDIFKQVCNILTQNL